ncbi:MAG: NAD(P)/FAD-dependent oxidoreductase [Proteobacteria bacterium]|nr:NAD(P)/FAD-dependent oxidoreductase [Pseudomonadota bacterium]
MQCKSATEFPWAGSHPWDVDIAIVGAGPAGLSAAIRLRWLKTMPPLPLSACLINSGPLGGLAQLGNSILTSPGLSFPAGELVKRLKRDLQKWPLPILRGKVVAVDHKKDHFKLTLEDGRQLTTLAVIMACGMLDIRNMADFWRQGVVATFGNRENIFTILKKELPTCANPLVVGGRHLRHLAKTIHTLNPKATLVVPISQQEVEESSSALIMGELQEIKEKDGKLVAAILKTAQGLIERQVDKVILEFNSLELERSPLPTGVPSQKNGFMTTCVHAQDVTPGLFGAGDCTGPPFAAVVALGQGAEAAFAAYRFVYEIKYGGKPALFAYYGDSEVTDTLTERDDFPLHGKLVPAKLIHDCPLPELNPAWSLVDGRRSIAELSKEKGLGEKELYGQLRKLIQERALTFCPVR